MQLNFLHNLDNIFVMKNMFFSNLHGKSNGEGNYITPSIQVEAIGIPSEVDVAQSCPTPKHTWTVR